MLDEEPTVVGYLKSIIPTKNDVISYIADTFPFVRWILNYNLQWFIGDLIAGLTVGMVVIPQVSQECFNIRGLTCKGNGIFQTSRLASPIRTVHQLRWSNHLLVFGSSKDVTIGPVAVASIVTGAILSEVANEHPVETREALAGTIAMLAGGVITALGLLRLGWIVDLISLPAVAAFITGSAVTNMFRTGTGFAGHSSHLWARSSIQNRVEHIQESPSDSHRCRPWPDLSAAALPHEMVLFMGSKEEAQSDKGNVFRVYFENRLCNGPLHSCFLHHQS